MHRSLSLEYAVDCYEERPWKKKDKNIGKNKQKQTKQPHKTTTKKKNPHQKHPPPKKKKKKTNKKPQQPQTNR